MRSYFVLAMVAANYVFKFLLLLSRKNTALNRAAATRFRENFPGQARSFR